MVRDITLAASGLLHPTMGGPSIMVPAPDFLFKPPASYGDFPWVNETGPDQFRRALYTYRRRSTPFPALTVFDAPPGDFSCVRRQRSNTPLQALTTLNEPLFFEAARALARRTLAEPGADTSRRLAHAFRHCVGRQPDAGELQILTALLERQTQHFASDPAAAQAFSNAQPDEDPQMLAAWTAVARVMLNLDETITKQ